MTHKIDIAVAAAGNVLSWAQGFSFGALASAATALYFGSKLILLWWDRCKKNKQPDDKWGDD